MGFYRGPKIVTDGLVSYLDAANPRSYDTRNLLNNTNSFTGWLNIPFNANIIKTNNNAIAPDGSLTATEVNFVNGGLIRFGFRNYLIRIGERHTFSVYVKAKSGIKTIFLDIADQANNGFTVNDFEWRRIHVTNTHNTSLPSNNFVDITSSGGSDFYLWGAQFNRGELIDYVPVNNDTKVIKDLSGNGNGGSLINGPIFNVDNNGIIIFDGVNDTIQLDEIVDLPNWTYSRWYNTDVFNDISLRLDDRIIISRFLRNFSGLLGITLDSNNNLYCGTFGSYKYNDVVRFCALKIKNNGEVDMGFDFGIPMQGRSVSINNILIKSDNSVGYIAGTNIAALRKFNTQTGETILDSSPSFSSISNTGLFLDEINNHVYLGGSFTVIDGLPYSGIARFDMDTLALDVSFDTSNGLDSLANSAKMTSIGEVYCVGPFGSYKGNKSRGIVRLTSNGEIDLNFNVGTGLDIVGFTSIFLDSNDKPIIVGGFTSYNDVTTNRIVRLNEDGSIDTTFDVGSGFNNQVSDIKIDYVNDKIYCVGRFTSYNGVSANRIVRLNMDGSIDSSFNIGTGFNKDLSAIAVQSDGKVIVGDGTGISYDNNSSLYDSVNVFYSFIRLEYSGLVDTSFDAGQGFTEATHRNELYISYTNSTGGIVTFTDFGNFPGTGRLNLDFFKDYYENKWHNFTLTKDSDNLFRVYNDGVLTGTLTPPIGSDLSLKYNRVQANGKLSNSLTYNKALTENEVLQNYDSIKFRYL
jgi:hypothetical protein